MSARRKALRADLIAAVETSTALYEPLAGRPVISAWAQDLDPRTLPVVGVALPLEQRDPLAMDTESVDYTVIVVVKLGIASSTNTDGPGGEDALDDAAEALIRPIEDSLIASGSVTARDVALRSSAIEISGTGSPRVGTLTLTFGVTEWRARTRP